MRSFPVALAAACLAAACGGTTDPGQTSPVCDTLQVYPVETDTPCDPVVVPGLCVQGFDPPSNGDYLVCLVDPDGTLWFAKMRGDMAITTPGWTHSAYANSAKPSTLSAADETRCSAERAAHGDLLAFCSSYQPDAGATWTSFSISVGAGPCPPGEICSWQWTLTPDSRLAIQKQGVASQAVMSDADFQAARQVVESAAFVARMQSGFTCPSPPTDVSESFTLTLASGTYSRDVTGCAYADTDTTGAAVLDGLITKY